MIIVIRVMTSYKWRLLIIHDALSIKYFVSVKSEPGKWSNLKFIFCLFKQKFIFTTNWYEKWSIVGIQTHDLVITTLPLNHSNKVSNFLTGQPRSLFVFKKTLFWKIVNLSRIRTRIVGLQGEYADHSTTTTVQNWAIFSYLIYSTKF